MQGICGSGKCMIEEVWYTAYAEALDSNMDRWVRKWDFEATHQSLGSG